MGLMQPSLFAFVAWQDVVQTQTWGAPTFTQSINDDALLFQWPAQGPDFGQTQVIGSFSYGSAACSDQICFGHLDAIMMHPEHIVWNGANYSPNPFPVDAIVWNTNDTNASVASGTQNIANATTGVSDGPIKIASPLPDSNNGYKQTHNLSNAGTIPAEESSSITWEDTVLASVLTNCSTDSLYNIAFSVTATGVGSTNCQNGTYVCPIEVDCQERSYTDPVTTVLSRTGSYDGSICNTRCTEVVAFDTGKIRIPVLSVAADTLTNMRLSIAPNHAGADSTFYTVCVIDSLLNGSAEITVTDTLGNSSIEQYEYCTIPDTLPPTITISGDTTVAGFKFYIRDDRPWDRGLDSIHIDTMFNVSLDSVPPNNLMGSSSYALAAHIINMSLSAFICLYAVDEAGNISNDTCVLYAVPQGVTPTQIEPISLSIFPSPMESVTTILLSGASAADVEIFDVLGREVDHFSIDGSYEWQTTALPSGTYIVRAVVNGASDAQTLTKRIVKE
jgi:hypothetical protein